MTKVSNQMLVAPSPLTTKGDLEAYNGTARARLPVGTNGQVLQADSTAATGVAWKDAAGGFASTGYVDGAVATQGALLLGRTAYGYYCASTSSPAALGSANAIGNYSGVTVSAYDASTTRVTDARLSGTNALVLVTSHYMPVANVSPTFVFLSTGHFDIYTIDGGNSNPMKGPFSVFVVFFDR
jgi:hypothetical protein